MKLTRGSAKGLHDTPRINCTSAIRRAHRPVAAPPRTVGELGSPSTSFDTVSATTIGGGSRPETLTIGPAGPLRPRLPRRGRLRLDRLPAEDRRLRDQGRGRGHLTDDAGPAGPADRVGHHDHYTTSAGRGDPRRVASGWRRRSNRPPGPFPPFRRAVSERARPAWSLSAWSCPTRRSARPCRCTSTLTRPRRAGSPTPSTRLGVVGRQRRGGPRRRRRVPAAARSRPAPVRRTAGMAGRLRRRGARRPVAGSGWSPRTSPTGWAPCWASSPTPSWPSSSPPQPTRRLDPSSADRAAAGHDQGHPDADPRASRR